MIFRHPYSFPTQLQIGKFDGHFLGPLGADADDDGDRVFVNRLDRHGHAVRVIFVNVAHLTENDIFEINHGASPLLMVLL